jgi:hypothetical protein
MNSYLQIAEAVLKTSRMPLSAREILEAAYRLQLVPSHLFGKTQYKTLHARLAEDLTRNRRTTIFVRTGPGRFFLRSKFKPKAGLPGEYVAPLRAYQLRQFEVICVKREVLNRLWENNSYSANFHQIESSLLHQVPLQHAERTADLIHVRIFVIIHCIDSVLTLTALAGTDLGRGRSLGLLGYLKGSDTDLFSPDSWGIDHAARRTIAEQSTLSPEEINALKERISTTSLQCLRLFDQTISDSIVIISSYECNNPDELLSNIPTHRSPRWVRVPSEINDITDFEPISNQLLRDQHLIDSVISARSL